MDRDDREWIDDRLSEYFMDTFTNVAEALTDIALAIRGEGTETSLQEIRGALNNIAYQLAKIQEHLSASLEITEVENKKRPDRGE